MRKCFNTIVSYYILYLRHYIYVVRASYELHAVILGAANRVVYARSQEI